MATEYDNRDLLRQRLTLRLINECIACLDEAVVEDKELLDAGMVFGTGFAPFRGGPMQYTQQQGAQTLKQQLEDLAAVFGSQFKPNSGWEGLL